MPAELLQRWPTNRAISLLVTPNRALNPHELRVYTDDIHRSYRRTFEIWARPSWLTPW